MRRYGYSFIKGSGADYLFSDLIEVIFFAGVVALSFLVILNPDHVKDFFLIFLLLLFVFGVLAILAEMLPKTSLFLSLIMVTGIYGLAVFGTVEFALSHKLDGVIFIYIGVQTIYYFAIAIVNAYLIRNAKKQKN
jgi:hypothetical protein